jgi:hypothetical protein
MTFDFGTFLLGVATGGILSSAYWAAVISDLKVDFDIALSKATTPVAKTRKKTA